MKIFIHTIPNTQIKIDTAKFQVLQPEEQTTEIFQYNLCKSLHFCDLFHYCHQNTEIKLNTDGTAKKS